MSSGSRRTRLVAGSGEYVGDLLPEGTLHASFVRSYLASAEVGDAGCDEARALPGVHAVFAGSELRFQAVPLREGGTGLAVTEWFPLAVDRVRYVGEPLAVVVASDPAVAEDAAELVDVGLSPLPVVASPEEGLDPGNHVLHPSQPSNLMFERHWIDESVDPAFAEASVLVDRTFRLGRQTALPMETRGVLAMPEPFTGRLLVWASTQIPHVLQQAIARFLGRPLDTVRVITPNVGGGFGLKASVAGEELVVAWLAGHLGQPVRWIEDRRENLVSGWHGHDQRIRLTVAFDADARLTAARGEVLVDVGAYSTHPFAASLEALSTARGLFACYNLPRFDLRVRAVATNKTPSGPYRGVGVPGAAFATERLLDIAAGQMDLDRVEIRRRNLVSVEAMPHPTPVGSVLDGGDYVVALDEVLARLGPSTALTDGRVVGTGMAVFIENSGPGTRAYSQRGVTSVPGFDSARVVMDQDGQVVVYASSAEAGQDHETMYRQIVSKILQIPLDRIRVVEGDTDACPPGSGTFASRAAPVQASSIAVAARDLAAQLLAAAADSLGVPISEVAWAEGGFSAGADSIALASVARFAHRHGGPPGGDSTPPLAGYCRWDPETTHPYGAHAAVVALDPDTFQVEVLRYVALDDCGTVLDPAGVTGQVVGGVAMGIGGALFEEHRYGDDGQPLTTSLVDYLVPLATDIPAIETLERVTPTDRTALGSRGVGEAGTIGAVAAVGSAVADAVRQLGGELNTLPASPNRLFHLVAAPEADVSP